MEINTRFEMKAMGFTLIKNLLGKDFPQRKRDELKIHVA